MKSAANLQFAHELVLIHVCGWANWLCHGILNLLHLVCLLVDLIQHLIHSSFLSTVVHFHSDFKQNSIECARQLCSSCDMKTGKVCMRAAPHPHR